MKNVFIYFEPNIVCFFPYNFDVMLQIGFIIEE